MKIAIVGSEGKHWTPPERTKAILKIKEILCRSRIIMGDKGFYEAIVDEVVLVSGGCGVRGEEYKQEFDGGVDVWAEIVADVLNIPKDVKYARAMQWEDKVISVAHSIHPEDPHYIGKNVPAKGFKTRNLEIAEECDILYCIDPAWRDWSGGRWTMREAEKLGKEVHLVLIE